MSRMIPATELDIVTPRFDLPVSESKVVYCIVASQRTGSYLLCRQLIAAGLGVPTEYFHNRFRRLLCKRQGIDLEDTDTYLAFLMRCRVTANGVFGFKLQRGQYLKNETTIDHLTKDQKFVVLYRSNLVKQAISLHESLRTGVWGNDESEQLTRPDPLIHRGDVGHIYECVLRIINQTNWLKDFFKERDIRPLVLKYEDFVVDQAAGIEKMAEFLGVDVDRATVQTEPYSRGNNDRLEMYETFCSKRETRNVEGIDDLCEFELTIS